MPFCWLAIAIGIDRDSKLQKASPYSAYHLLCDADAFLAILCGTWLRRRTSSTTAFFFTATDRRRRRLSLRYDFKTTFHKNPQLTTTYCQKAPIAQYVRRIDGQITVRFCAICSIYIMPKALGDVFTVSILIGGCVFLFAKLVCAAILPRVYIPTLHRGKMAKWRHTQGSAIAIT